jgi:hypothetical protein
MPQAHRVGERTGNATANDSALTELLGGGAQPLLLATTISGAAVRLDVGMPVATVSVANATALTHTRALSLHEWIPMGALSDRTQCRCCHCGVVRRYDLRTDARVQYSKYANLLSEGELETTDVPACAPAGSRMPLSVGARSWDMLSWV